ncbi:MAG TPA: ABC transporter ATP-binding protein [Acetivibrio clariflavus]|nr:ABC transporter ATP-binding protein [Acetivibrio clariflavus]
MIEIINVSKKFNSSGEGNEFWALKDINLTIETGEFVAIVGRSGSGKSTLMNLIGTLDKPTSGNIYIDKEDIVNMTNQKKELYRNQKMGFIFQAFYLEPTYTVYENVEMPMLIKGVSHKERRKAIEESLSKVGLLHKAYERAKFLSGGEQQRVSIARALVNNPGIILADEPCGNLDSNNSNQVMNILAELNLEGKTVIMITHNMEDANKAKRIITIYDGKIIGDRKLKYV